MYLNPQSKYNISMQTIYLKGDGGTDPYTTDKSMSYNNVIILNPAV